MSIHGRPYGLTTILTTVGCTIAAFTLPEMTPTLAISIGLLLGSVAIATAPAATWFTLREYNAKGPTTDHLIVLTGINNLTSIIFFHILFVLLSGMGMLGVMMEIKQHWWIDLFFVSIGSIGLGLVLGLILAMVHSRLPLREMILLFFATLFLLSAGDNWLLHVVGYAFNPMVTCLAMGAAFANTARDPGFFEQTLETVSMPIFALFFVLAGFNLHLEELSHLGALGIVYIVMRSAGKYFGVRLAAQSSRKMSLIKKNTGLGLLCQAGVAIGIGSFLESQWDHPAAKQINTIILASVAIYELIGPLLLKYTAIRSGEVKAVTLLRPGLFRPTWISSSSGQLNLLDKYASAMKQNEALGQQLQAKHLMRTNVHFLAADASFNDVLSFIERSRFHDFPVSDSDGIYMGIVHFRSIRDQVYDPAFTHLVTAVDLADSDTPPVTPDTDAEHLLELFHSHNLGAIAVVENTEKNHLIGIVEQRDLLQALHGTRQGNKAEGK